MSDSIKQAIIKTFIYSDIFDYPLKKGELWQYLIDGNASQFSIKNFNKAFMLLDLYIEKQDEFYFFSGRTSIVTTRKRRQKESLGKLEIAHRVSSALSMIPTIQLIAVSGALAMNNADKSDDIDLFIIVKKNTLWITRLLTLLVLEILRKRRKKGDVHVSNKICANMFIDETTLLMPTSTQDLYTAHEIAQIKVLVERNNMYKKFILANKWVEKFLPNASKKNTQTNTSSKKDSFIAILLLLETVEYFVKVIQLWRINKHRTIETITDHILAFHPKNYRKIILDEFQKRIKAYAKI